MDAESLWTTAARLIVEPEHLGGDHGITDDGSTFCGLSPDRIEIYRHPFDGRGRSDCRTCARRMYEAAGLAGQEPPPAA